MKLTGKSILEAKFVIMVTAVINLKGAKVKNRLLISRKDLCDLLDIKSKTLTNRLGLYPEYRKAQIKLPIGEMWDLERVLSISIQISKNEGET